MQKLKPTWDTRAWLVGIASGAVGGNLAAWTTYAPIQRRLNALPSPLFNGRHTTGMISGLAIVLCVLILPGLMSGLARRWTFFWGLVPLSLFLVSVDLEEWVENGIKSATKDWSISLAIIGGCLVISSGPVSLIRWLRVRAARHHAALLASYQVQRGAASEPQEGVWPPPPEYGDR